MRALNKIIIHCADSKPSMDIGREEITKWHTDPKSEGGRGWSDIGYHYVIRKNGEIEICRSIEKMGAHCFGQNKGSIGVCWVGGYGGVDDRTPDQITSLIKLVDSIHTLFGKMSVHGHNEFSTKTCPNFDVSLEF